MAWIGFEGSHEEHPEKRAKRTVYREALLRRDGRWGGQAGWQAVMGLTSRPTVAHERVVSPFGTDLQKWNHLLLWRACLLALENTISFHCWIITRAESPACQIPILPRHQSRPNPESCTRN